MSFEGFSEADIIKLAQKSPTSKDALHDKTVAKHKKVSFKINHKQQNPNKLVLNEKLKNEEADLPQAAKLQPEIKKVQSDETVPQSPKIEEQKVDETNKNESTTEKKVKNLNELQARQKLMEEQNRKRKELLAKALADRTKRTQEEAQRLNEIQIELKKLDATLSNDVKILRKQIDIASVDYMEAQKRYLKVEKEFLEAKLYLQQKLEKKELLTEHLCAIIGKNEERKAKKLTELLEKLKLDPKMAENEVVCQNGEVSSTQPDAT